MILSPELMQALNRPEDGAPLRFLTGLVRTVNTGTVPATMDVDVEGVTIPGLLYSVGWDPEPGSVAWLLRQGSTLIVFGTPAPARVVVGAHNHTTPPVNPASPDAPPAAPSAVVPPRSATVTATSSATWVAAFSNWRTDKVIAGGATNERGFFFYGSGVAAAKGSGTIVGGTVTLKRSGSGGVFGPANVRVGTHGYTTQPGSDGTPLSNVVQIGTLGQGQGLTLPLASVHIADLNAGAAGIGIEPGSLSYTSADYLICEPRDVGDWSGQLNLTIQD